MVVTAALASDFAAEGARPLTKELAGARSRRCLRRRAVDAGRPQLDRRRVVRSADLLLLEPERKYRVAGLVLLRQRPSTAKGITFMTLEDETGTTNLVVHVNVWERFRLIARGATALLAHGILQRQNDVVHLVVDKMEDLTDILGEHQNASRDFR